MTTRPRKAPKRESVRGLTWNRGRAVWQRQHQRLPGGSVSRPLGTRDHDLAEQYAGALNTLMERGDWGVLARFARAEIHVTDILHAVREGEYDRLKRLNVEGALLGAAYDEFLRIVGRNLKPATYRQARAFLDQLLARHGRAYPMASLTTSEAQAFLDGQAWMPNTLHAARKVYGALWRMVIRHERDQARVSGAVPAVTENPWREARTPRLRRTRHAFILPAEWRDLAAHPDVVDTPVLAVLALGVLAGLREGEIAQLRPDLDVDFAGRRVRVQNRTGEYAWTTKTERSQRDVPMVPALRRILERHAELGYAGRRYFIRGAGKDTPLSTSTIRDWVKSAFRAAGLKYGRQHADALTMHSTRHTCATWLVSAGVPIPTVAAWLGDTPEMVLSTYAHHMAADQMRAERVIEEAASGP